MLCSIYLFVFLQIFFLINTQLKSYRIGISLFFAHNVLPMIKNNLIKVYFTLLLLVSSISITAQTTFGSLDAPVDGALLQLKNFDNSSTNSTVNADKGLLLPRVKLTDIHNLYPMFPLDYNKQAEDFKHTGLFVFNTNDNLFDGDGQGCYLWDGTKWMGMGMEKRRISISPLNVYISEQREQATAQIATIPLNLPFELSVSGPNSSTHTMVDGKLTFTRNPLVSGNKKYTLTLKNSTRSATITVNHLKLRLAKDVIKVGENGSVATSAVEVDGGDAKWIVKGYSENAFNWTTAPYNDGDNNLRFKLGAAKQESGIVKGYIDVAHINDPNYVQRVEVWQNKDYIMLPEFDFLVVRYKYSGGGSYDLDTATEINMTEIATVDGKGAGWNTGNDSRLPSGAAALVWGNDNRQSGYETTYGNMTDLRAVVPAHAAREFNVDMYANWYNGGSQAVPPSSLRYITITITLYRGGHMRSVNTYDFENVGGTKELELTRTNLSVPNAGNKGSNWRRDYAGLLRLEYDRIDETGLVMELKSIPRSMSVSVDQAFYEEFADEIDAIDMLPNESKDEFAARRDKLVEKLKKEKGR